MYQKDLVQIFVFWHQKIRRYTLNMDFNNSTFYLLVGYVLSNVFKSVLDLKSAVLVPVFVPAPISVRLFGTCYGILLIMVPYIF